MHVRFRITGSPVPFRIRNVRSADLQKKGKPARTVPRCSEKRIERTPSVDGDIRRGA